MGRPPNRPPSRDPTSAGGPASPVRAGRNRPRASTGLRGTTTQPPTLSRSTVRGMTSFPPAALTQSPPRELRPPWDDDPTAHPLEIHPSRDDQLPPVRAGRKLPLASSGLRGDSNLPRGPHHAKPHRLFLASDRARYGPHPLACKPPCPAGSAPASTGPPAQPAAPATAATAPFPRRLASPTCCAQDRPFAGRPASPRAR